MTTDNPWGLSSAQIKALEAVTVEGDNKKAARRLGRSPKTVELHMRAVRQRMQSHTIGCCVAWAKWSIADE